MVPEVIFYPADQSSLSGRPAPGGDKAAPRRDHGPLPAYLLALEATLTVRRTGVVGREGGHTRTPTGLCSHVVHCRIWA